MTQVWCANIFSNMKAFAPYEGPASTSEQRQALMSVAAKNRFGHVMSREEFPARITSMDTPPRALKDYAFISGRIPMVSPKLAEALRGLDIGESQFFATEFYSEDGTEALEHKHLFWNLGNRKETLSPSDCRGIFQLRAPAGRKIAETYASSDTTEDDDLAVSAEALTGADFWVEGAFSDTVFFSARFEQMLSENGLRDLFPLKSVRVL